MLEGRASATAMMVATQRAAHQVLDVPLVFEDPLAVAILGVEPEEAAARGRELETTFGPAFRAAIVARSRYADDLLAAALSRGARQVVLLGAGLDTIPYRIALPAGVRAFEVDHPATQAWKREMLAAAGIAIPASVSFVGVDFEVTTLEEMLTASSFDRGRPAFFTWLGVAYYLSADEVRATLGAIGGLVAGTEVVFDYFAPERHDAPGLDDLGDEVASVGEPWRSTFTAGAMADELRAAGFARSEDLDSAAMARRSFAGRTDDLTTLGPIHFARAVV